MTPVKAAVTTWLPAASAAVLNAAWPAASTGTAEASTVAPSVNVTVPTGTPPVEVTVAVKVTEVPELEGLGDEVNAVAVLEVVESPQYWACLPMTA